MTAGTAERRSRVAAPAVPAWSLGVLIILFCAALAPLAFAAREAESDIAFAARLKDAVDLDSVRDDLAGVVHQALEPAHVSVWISSSSPGTSLWSKSSGSRRGDPGLQAGEETPRHLPGNVSDSR